MHVTAIVPAAGGGSRLPGSVRKQYRRLGEVPLLTRTLQALTASGAMQALVLVVPPGDEATCQAEVLTPYGLRVDALVAGGADRQASVYAGLLRCAAGTDLILVHDGARPLITAEVIWRAVAAAEEVGAAVAALPVTDTIKRADGAACIRETPPRDELWAAQTPQVFRAALFREAHARALAEGFRSTDDSGLVERLGHPVRLVRGSRENFKVTTLADLRLAAQLLEGGGGA